MSEHQPDLFDAQGARDEALARVAANSGDWLPTALDWLRGCAGRGGDFTGEELRLMLVGAGCPEPHHHNAWGALIQQALRRGLICPTGRRRKMRTCRSHARTTAVYAWRYQGE